MFSHEPVGYECPLCRYVSQKYDEINDKEFVIYEDEKTIAFVSPLWWVSNPGNVIVIPKEHVENIYNISDELLGDVYKTAKEISVAIKKSYRCDGVSMRQHNEPAGNQDVWHFHVHILPRYTNDELFKNDEKYRWVGRKERIKFVNLLKKYFLSVSNK